MPFLRIPNSKIMFYEYDIQSYNQRENLRRGQSVGRRFSRRFREADESNGVYLPDLSAEKYKPVEAPLELAFLSHKTGFS